MTTREQILKDIIIDDIKNDKPMLDIVNHCYDILSVLYCSFEEYLYDFACDIVNTIIAANNINSVKIDLNNKKIGAINNEI